MHERTCAFCDHPILYLGPPKGTEVNRRFCFDCLPAISTINKPEYMRRYHVLRRACGMTTGPQVAVSIRLPANHPAKAGRKPALPKWKVERPCEFCSQPFMPRGPHSKYCSAKCLNRNQRRHGRKASSERQAVVPEAPLGSTEAGDSKSQVEGVKRAAMREVLRLWPTGTCGRCDGPLQPWWEVTGTPSPRSYCYACYLEDHAARYKKKNTGQTNCVVCSTPFQRQGSASFVCSPECRAELRRSRVRRHNARRRGAPVGEHYTMRLVYDRDEGTCHLCGDPVDIMTPPSEPMGPTIDHVIPISLGGLDCFTNVRLAHRVCNVSRNNRPLEDVTHDR